MDDQISAKYRLQVPREWISMWINPYSFEVEIRGVRPPEGIVVDGPLPRYEAFKVEEHYFECDFLFENELDAMQFKLKYF